MRYVFKRFPLRHCDLHQRRIRSEGVSMRSPISARQAYKPHGLPTVWMIISTHSQWHLSRLYIYTVLRAYDFDDHVPGSRVTTTLAPIQLPRPRVLLPSWTSIVSVIHRAVHSISRQEAIQGLSIGKGDLSGAIDTLNGIHKGRNQAEPSPSCDDILHPRDTRRRDFVIYTAPGVPMAGDLPKDMLAHIDNRIKHEIRPQRSANTVCRHTYKTIRVSRRWRRLAHWLDAAARWVGMMTYGHQFVETSHSFHTLIHEAYTT